MIENLFKNVPISDSTKEYIGDFKPTTDADFYWLAKNISSLLKDIEQSVKNGEDLSEIYPNDLQSSFESSLMDLKDIRDEQELDTLVKCSEKAEDVKLGDMENWLDSQLANTNPNSQEHEHIFKLYNSISDIRTFYAQHLFNKKESV